MEQKTIDVLANTPKIVQRKSGSYYMQPVFLLTNGQKTKAKTFSSKELTENKARIDIERQIDEFVANGEHLLLGGLSNTDNPLFRNFYKVWEKERFNDEYISNRGREEAVIKIKYILQEIGTIPVKDIDHDLLDGFYKKLRFNDVRNGKKRNQELSQETVRKYSAILIKIFDYAVSKKVIISNPVRQYELSLPTALKKRDNSKNKKVDYFSKYETEVIIEEAFKVNLSWGLFVFLALNTGMRRGELIALDINSSFDFSRNVITIDKSINSSKEKRLVIDTPKNGKSREVYISDELKELIQEQIEIRNKFTEKNRDTITWNATYPLFIPETKNKLGQPYAPHSISQKWQLFMKDVVSRYPDVRYFNLHILRHTFGTRLLNNHMPLELVSEALGHSSISMTERYYVNPSSERIKCMVDYLDFKFPKTMLKW
ncbi:MULTISPECIES: site-specific integrase [Vagococcus]|uniref:Prophage LambdaBa04, site-specific recombinase, phage integrase family n=1 Tax=Vagococcus fluvialis bH819 TaxID=1255619 RepID=A0A1X6WMH4_9ENTE|nr:MULTISPECIES: site-specific integrase [Vagococcus]SLM85465.1 Prophage LambdaBa04, site-specific recombinase, phage integrase family [Vagococcus fluvialis bH819]HCM89242.1 site-specific integrase [Vagococcus sp.]